MDFNISPDLIQTAPDHSYSNGLNFKFLNSSSSHVFDLVFHNAENTPKKLDKRALESLGSSQRQRQIQITQNRVDPQ